MSQTTRWKQTVNRRSDIQKEVTNMENRITSRIGRIEIPAEFGVNTNVGVVHRYSRYGQQVVNKKHNNTEKV